MNALFLYFILLFSFSYAVQDPPQCLDGSSVLIDESSGLPINPYSLPAISDHWATWDAYLCGAISLNQNQTLFEPTAELGRVQDNAAIREYAYPSGVNVDPYQTMAAGDFIAVNTGDAAQQIIDVVAMVDGKPRTRVFDFMNYFTTTKRRTAPNCPSSEVETCEHHEPGLNEYISRQWFTREASVWLDYSNVTKATTVSFRRTGDQRFYSFELGVEAGTSFSASNLPPVRLTDDNIFWYVTYTHADDLLAAAGGRADAAVWSRNAPHLNAIRIFPVDQSPELAYQQVVKDYPIVQIGTYANIFWEPHNLVLSECGDQCVSASFSRFYVSPIPGDTGTRLPLEDESGWGELTVALLFSLRSDGSFRMKRRAQYVSTSEDLDVFDVARAGHTQVRSTLLTEDWACHAPGRNGPDTVCLHLPKLWANGTMPITNSIHGTTYPGLQPGVWNIGRRIFSLNDLHNAPLAPGEQPQAVQHGAADTLQAVEQTAVPPVYTHTATDGNPWYTPVFNLNWQVDGSNAAVAVANGSKMIIDRDLLAYMPGSNYLEHYNTALTASKLFIRHGVLVYIGSDPRSGAAPVLTLNELAVPADVARSTPTFRPVLRKQSWFAFNTAERLAEADYKHFAPMPVSGQWLKWAGPSRFNPYAMLVGSNRAYSDHLDQYMLQVAQPYEVCPEGEYYDTEAGYCTKGGDIWVQRAPYGQSGTLFRITHRYNADLPCDPYFLFSYQVEDDRFDEVEAHVQLPDWVWPLAETPWKMYSSRDLSDDFNTTQNIVGKAVGLSNWDAADKAFFMAVAPNPETYDASKPAPAVRMQVELLHCTSYDGKIDVPYGAFVRADAYPLDETCDGGNAIWFNGTTHDDMVTTDPWDNTKTALAVPPTNVYDQLTGAALFPRTCTGPAGTAPAAALADMSLLNTRVLAPYSKAKLARLRAAAAAPEADAEVKAEAEAAEAEAAVLEAARAPVACPRGFACPRGLPVRCGLPVRAADPAMTAYLRSILPSAERPDAYQDAEGQVECKYCPAGTAVLVDEAGLHVGCTACPAGYLTGTQTGVAVGACHSCHQDGYVAASATDRRCTKCDFGFTNNDDHTACVPASAAFDFGADDLEFDAAKHASLAEAEKVCPRGHFCRGSDRWPCPIGQYQPYAGEEYCRRCPPGSFSADDEGRAVLAGATTCSTCPAGHACRNGARPMLCPAGQYQPAQGQTSCLACPASSHAELWHVTDGTTCQFCEVGSVFADGGCQVCADNCATKTDKSGLILSVAI